jgi:uncharacterized protein YndB with AHSA1/START domain
MKKPLTLVLLFAVVTAFAQMPERYICTSIDINAPVDTVWSRWASPAGLKRFFVSQSRIELQTMGRLDFYMDPSAPEGKKGAENNRVLAWQPNKLLSFTWDAPPSFPEIRKQRTTVIIRFTELPNNKTNVTLTQIGFGSGADWDAVVNYFDKAWGGFVLPRLKHSCEVSGSTIATIPANLPAAKKL